MAKLNIVNTSILQKIIHKYTNKFPFGSLFCFVFCFVLGFLVKHGNRMAKYSQDRLGKEEQENELYQIPRFIIKI